MIPSLAHIAFPAKKKQEFAASATHIHLLLQSPETGRKGVFADMPGKCPVCQKSVYAAEERKAVGKSFHKVCFVCHACRKMLDSTNMATHGDDIYCSACYRDRAAPRGCVSFAKDCASA